MATSSIFSNVVISSEDSAKAVVKAYENFQKNPKETMSSIDVRKASDPSNIRRILGKLVI